MSVASYLLVRAAAGLVGAATLAGGTLVVAAGFDGAASVSSPAERVVRPVGDVAVVFDVGDVDRAVVEAADRVAARIGGTASVSRTGSLGMRAITRGAGTVHSPPSGYLIPMVYTSFPRGSVGRVLGPDVARVLEQHTVVMNQMTADMTGAAVGDVIVMQAANGSPRSLTIAGIRPRDEIGSAELVFTTDVADALGATTDTRVVIYDFDDRDVFDDAIDAEGLSTRRDTKVNRSWDPPDPDDTLSTADTKIKLGEPWYTFTSSSSIAMHPTWIDRNLHPERELLNETVRLRARCHVDVVDDLRAALADVASAGLAHEIDVANANAYGGCYAGARYSRVSGQIGFLSRHSYGMALDTNTVSNCQGCVPVMNCEVVRIFRKHGFAWGGNFRRPDGMHFEWVGERRDQIDYPSNYCPNLTTGAASPGSRSSAAEIGADVFLAGEADRTGMAHDHPHAP